MTTAMGPYAVSAPRRRAQVFLRQGTRKRLYDAIEAGVADLHDPALKDRIDGLKAIRD